MNKHVLAQTPSLARAFVATDQGKAAALILGAAGCSLVASVSLFVLGQREQGIFIGLWVPSILSFGHFVMKGMDHE